VGARDSRYALCLCMREADWIKSVSEGLNREMIHRSGFRTPFVEGVLDGAPLVAAVVAEDGPLNGDRIEARRPLLIHPTDVVPPFHSNRVDIELRSRPVSVIWRESCDDGDHLLEELLNVCLFLRRRRL
jgi:hypothetical protein